MKLFLAGTLGLIICLPPVCTGQTDPTSVCLAMVHEAAHNINLSTSSSQYLNTLFDNSCKKDGSTKQGGWNAGLSAVIEDIPVSLTGGSTNSETAYSNFCRNYASSNQGSASSFSWQSLVVEKALGSANQCLAIATKGTYLYYKVMTPDTLAINFSIGSGNTLRVRGISHSTAVTCEGAKASGSGAFAYSTGVGQTLTSDFGTYSITCTRRPESGASKSSRYLETSLVVDTNAGGFDIYWPQDALLPLRDANDIETAIEDLGRQTDKNLKDGVAQVLTSMEPYTSGTRFILASPCPAGWAELGSVGIIFDTSHWDKNPFTPGAPLQESPSWHWVHPVLCKR